MLRFPDLGAVIAQYNQFRDTSGGTEMKIGLIAAIVALPAVLESPALAQALLPVNASPSVSASSRLAGAQAGYNWQTNAFVYGFEADISATHLKSEMNTALATGLPTTANTNADVDWFGTVRGRFGWAPGPILFYGTGGLAYGRIELNSSMNMPGVPMFVNAQASPVNVGWVAGGGLEYLWRPNLMLNLDYQHVDLGTVSVASSSTAFSGLLSQSATAHAQFDVATVRLSWLVSPTGATPPGTWRGLYAGGHAGGAWGNSESANYSALTPVPSDVRLKRDITLVGRLDNGLGLYRYRYLWSDTVYIGVMAQEVALIHPDAIIRDGLDDYLRVDYARLGLKLMALPAWEAVGESERLTP
jgi:outer membrane immunogenic protein